MRGWPCAVGRRSRYGRALSPSRLSERPGTKWYCRTGETGRGGRAGREASVCSAQRWHAGRQQQPQPLPTAGSRDGSSCKLTLSTAVSAALSASSWSRVQDSTRSRLVQALSVGMKTVLTMDGSDSTLRKREGAAAGRRGSRWAASRCTAVEGRQRQGSWCTAEGRQRQGSAAAAVALTCRALWRVQRPQRRWRWETGRSRPTGCRGRRAAPAAPAAAVAAVAAEEAAASCEAAAADAAPVAASAAAAPAAAPGRPSSCFGRRLGPLAPPGTRPRPRGPSLQSLGAGRGLRGAGARRGWCSLAVRLAEAPEGASWGERAARAPGEAEQQKRRKQAGAHERASERRRWGGQQARRAPPILPGFALVPCWLSTPCAVCLRGR